MDPDGPVAPESVNHLVLNVSNMERSHEWWTRMLGFRQVGEVERPEAKLWMRFYSGATGSHHDVALAQLPEPPQEDAEPPRARPGLNHVAIKWPDRESWLRQIAWLQSQGVRFQSRVDHGMTHSVYIADPDGHGIEVLYELPREVWEGDINAALNHADVLPREGPEALQDNTDYKVFSRYG